MTTNIRNVKQLCRKAAHKLAHPVIIKMIKAQLLHMAEQIPPDIGLHKDPKIMPPVPDHIGKYRPEHIGSKHSRQNAPEGLPWINFFSQNMRWNLRAPAPALCPNIPAQRYIP